jgi:hypothetical protein
MATITPYLESLVRETHKSESEVVALAIETGLRQLWREQILVQYLHGQISREQAAQSVGADWVELAEKQQRAAKEDVEWATTPQL